MKKNIKSTSKEFREKFVNYLIEANKRCATISSYCEAALYDYDLSSDQCLNTILMNEKNLIEFKFIFDKFCNEFTEFVSNLDSTKEQNELIEFADYINAEHTLVKCKMQDTFETINECKNKCYEIRDKYDNLRAKN
jgi:hypothetical protein